MPAISIIMPAYNTEKYIEDAINSIINQSFTNWELIIVDDCSTDNTAKIVERYVAGNEKIKLYKRSVNSGGGRLPRFEGIKMATGNFVSAIDADDFIEPDFLEKLYDRQKQTSANIVLPKMIFCHEDGTPNGNTVPDLNFDMNVILSGRDACRLTLGSWKIGLNAMLVSSCIYKQHIESLSLELEYNGTFMDEIDGRKILLLASSIALIDVHYFYRQQPDSICHRVSINRFTRLDSEGVLYRFASAEFGDDKAVMNSVYNKYVWIILSYRRLFISQYHHFTQNERKIIRQKIKTAFEFAKKRKTKSSKQHIYFSNYPVFILATRCTYLISGLLCRRVEA